MQGPDLSNRRPLASRSTAAARRLAGALGRSRITPDQISALGLLAAAGAGAALIVAPAWPPGWLLGAIGIQLRLLANLLDGMVAVEGAKGSPLGPLWNEVPDRIEDTVILAGLGSAVGAPMLGLWAAIAALICAYLRVLGGALGQPQDFAGPMAKQHRMAAATAACIVGFATALIGAGGWLAGAILWVILIGTVLTCARRLGRLAARLKAR